MGLVLAFAEIAGAVLFLTAAITGANFSQVLSGQALVAYRRQEQAGASQANTTTTTSPTSSSSTSGVAPSGPGETAFFTALLKSLGAPVTKANLDSLASWKQHESSGWPPPNAFNPLNTKQAEPGSHPNPANGVSIFPDAATGIAALVHNLPNYPCIIAHLRSGQGCCRAPCGADFLKFSGGGYSGVC